MAIYLGATELSTGGGGGGGGGFTKEYNLRGNIRNGRVYPFGYTGGNTAITIDQANATALANGTKCTLWFNSPVTDGPYIIQKTGSSGGNYNNFDFVSTPPSTSHGNNTVTICNINTDVTVNPATDLGLVDGASIGYFMIGGGASGYDSQNQSTNAGGGGNGGRFRSGTLTIATASTDLVLTCGNGGGRSLAEGDSTIVYGATTLSTSGFPFGKGAFRTAGYGSSSWRLAEGFQGINGYGMGGGAGNNIYDVGGVGPDFPQGYGTGGSCTTSTSFTNFAGGAGSVILYY